VLILHWFTMKKFRVKSK